MVRSLLKVYFLQYIIKEQKLEPGMSEFQKESQEETKKENFLSFRNHIEIKWQSVVK